MFCLCFRSVVCFGSVAALRALCSRPASRSAFMCTVPVSLNYAHRACCLPVPPVLMLALMRRSYSGTFCLCAQWLLPRQDPFHSDHARRHELVGLFALPPHVAAHTHSHCCGVTSITPLPSAAALALLSGPRMRGDHTHCVRCCSLFRCNNWLCR